MRAFAAPALVLILAACSPAAEPATDEATPAATPATTQLGAIDLTQPLRSAGTEPFWTIDIADGVMTYRDMEDFAGDIAAPRTGPATPVVTGDTAVYNVTLTDGKALVLTLKNEACPDIGEETRALTASLAMGGATQEACADARTAYPPES